MDRPDTVHEEPRPRDRHDQLGPKHEGKRSKRRDHESGTRRDGGPQKAISTGFRDLGGLGEHRAQLSPHAQRDLHDRQPNHRAHAKATRRQANTSDLLATRTDGARKPMTAAHLRPESTSKQAEGTNQAPRYARQHGENDASRNSYRSPQAHAGREDRFRSLGLRLRRWLWLPGGLRFDGFGLFRSIEPLARLIHETGLHLPAKHRGVDRKSDNQGCRVGKDRALPSIQRALGRPGRGFNPDLSYPLPRLRLLSVNGDPSRGVGCIVCLATEIGFHRRAYSRFARTRVLTLPTERKRLTLRRSGESYMRPGEPEHRRREEGLAPPPQCPHDVIIAEVPFSHGAASGVFPRISGALTLQPKTLDPTQRLPRTKGAVSIHRSMMMIAAIAGSTACHGELELRVFGESFVEDGIPRDAVSDGWAISFDEFVVAVTDVTVHGEETIALDDTYVFDLARSSDGAGHPLATLAVPADDYTHIGYRLAAPAAIEGGNADATQRQRLLADGAALQVAGTATKQEETLGFSWSFAVDFGYICATSQQVRTGTKNTAELTIHADHLFADDFFVEPRLAFDLVATADEDGDGIVTTDELASVSLEAESRYWAGDPSIADLRRYIGNIALTMAHVNGEGACEGELVPAAYREHELSPTDSAAADGAQLFEQHCASCHGPDGTASDSIAAALDPPPTDLSNLSAAASDPAYLHFRIAEGGGFFPYDSAMPGLGHELSDSEIAALVAHTRALAAL